MSGRLDLRALDESQFDELERWFSSERDILVWAGPGGVHGVRHCLQATLDGTQSDPAQFCGWSLFDGDALAAHFQLRLDRLTDTVRLGRIAVAPARRGEGLGAEVTRAAIETAFAFNWAYRLELNVYAFNDAAIALYRRAGFEIEGVNRAAAKCGEERWDNVMMSLLRPDWRQGRTGQDRRTRAV